MKFKGFSLVEIIIAVMIIAIIALVAVPKTLDLVRKSQEGATKGNLGALRSAIALYYANNDGAFPEGNIADVLVKDGYIKEIPYAYCPPYHAKNNTIITVVDDTLEAGDTGGWAYKSTDTDGNRQWGEIWVNCTHEDSRQKTWSQY
jgi:prepilin-type N-terminal cleavage/methylation domain-containing protein